MSKKAQTWDGKKGTDRARAAPLHYTPNAPLGVRKYAVGRVWRVLHSFLASPYESRFLNQ